MGAYGKSKESDNRRPLKRGVQTSGVSTAEVPLYVLGAPNQEFLAQEITSSDHPFLRGNVPSIQSYRRAIKGTPAFQPVPSW